MTQYADEREYRHVYSKISGLSNDAFNVPEGFGGFNEESNAL